MQILKGENMNEFNFKSAICTSRVQSEHLLALGLRKETADMCWRTTTLNGEPITYLSQDVWLNGSIITNNHFPAWSLHRLLMMLDSDVQTDGRYVSLPNYGFVKNDNIYDNVIDCIEWLIKEGYFPKEYLEE